MSDFWIVYWVATAACLVALAAGAYVAGRYGVDVTVDEGKWVGYSVLAAVSPVVNVVVPVVLSFAVVFFGAVWLLAAGVGRLNKAGRARHQR